MIAKECLPHPHDACPCREEAFKNLLEVTKAAIITLDKIQGADRLGILLARAIAEAEKAMQP